MRGWKKWTGWPLSALCAALFAVNAGINAAGIHPGGSVDKFKLFIALLWSAGAILWAVRAVRERKQEQTNTDQNTDGGNDHG